MSDLLKLAERCEAATGADRELDCQIAYGVGFLREYREPMDRHGTLVGVESDTDRAALFAPWWSGREDHREDWLRIAEDMSVPAYTASLDAAMTLVPEGLKVRMGMGTLMGKYSAVTEIVRGNAAELLKSFVGETVATADAATPALALTAAALRARSTPRDDRDTRKDLT